jgi:membrane protein YdbS with pleckstrin-like domain
MTDFDAIMFTLGILAGFLAVAYAGRQFMRRATRPTARVLALILPAALAIGFYVVGVDPFFWWLVAVVFAVHIWTAWIRPTQWDQHGNPRQEP